MERESLIVIDDYFDASGGVQRAVGELVKQTGDLVFLGPAPQVTILKGVTTGTSQGGIFAVTGTDIPIFSVEHLYSLESYRHFLVRTCSLLGYLSVDIRNYLNVVNGGVTNEVDLASRTFKMLGQIVYGPEWSRVFYSQET
jgi:hypothetical protein